MLSLIERFRSGSKAFRMNELLRLGVFLLVNFAFVLPIAAQTHDDEALHGGAEHLTLKDHEEAAKIVRDRPQERSAIILSKASSDQLLNYWDLDNRLASAVDFSVGRLSRVDALLLYEITDRLVAAQSSEYAKTMPALPIDTKQSLAVITEAIVTDRARMAALECLCRLPTVKLDPKTFHAIVACLDDETTFMSGRECSFWSIRGGAVDVLSQHIHQYEKELAGLLDDERGHRRCCGIQILSRDAQVFDQHGDRIFEMLEDQDERVRSSAAYHLPLLVKRLPEVVTFLISQKPTYGVCRSIDSTFEKCNSEDQNRLLHWLVEGTVQDSNSRCADSLCEKLPSVEQADLDELLDLMLAKLDLKTAERSQLSVLSAAGARAKHALPEMRKALLDADQEIENKLLWARAIYEIAGDAEEVLPYFRTALETDDGPLHKSALLGVRAVGPDAAELANLMASHLDQPKTGQHWYLMALRAIGPRATGVLPKLEALQAATSQTSSSSYLANAIKSIRGER